MVIRSRGIQSILWSMSFFAFFELYSREIAFNVQAEKTLLCSDKPGNSLLMHFCPFLYFIGMCTNISIGKRTYTITETFPRADRLTIYRARVDNDDGVCNLNTHPHFV